MAYKDILVHVDDTQSSVRRLDIAVDLARTHGAHLTGIYRVPEIDPSEYLGPNIRMERIEALHQRVAAAAATAQQTFEAATGDAGVSSEWHPTSSSFADRLLEGCPYVDLVVAGQSRPEEGRGGDVAEGFVISAGRPVLIVPYVDGPGSAGKRILVAWNETREATRAVHDALPLLERAELVQVINIERQRSDAATRANEALCRHLARHGVTAQAQQWTEAEVHVADVLLSRATDLGIDLIVMGAYGHSRLREMVLGGATREMLAEMTVPVLMSH